MTEVNPAATQTSLDPGQVFAEKYRIERLLGQGGSGTVFAATHLWTNRVVAIKTMHEDLARIPEAAERLRREARLTGLVRHPNIVDIFDVGFHDHTLYLVMEYLRGQPLGAFLGNGPMRIGPVVHTISLAMRGVAAAHEADVVHRDLKPDNIFVCCGDAADPSRVKVLDFGVSKRAPRALGVVDSELTLQGAMVGTPHYMAPEQVFDSRTVDRRADIYSLGVCLYEALIGECPFETETLGALVLEIMQKGLPPVASRRPDLPNGLAEVIDRAVALKPEHRFQDVESMLKALAPYAESPGLIGSDPREPPLFPRPKSAPRPKLLLVERSNSDPGASDSRDSGSGLHEYPLLAFRASEPPGKESDSALRSRPAFKRPLDSSAVAPGPVSEPPSDRTSISDVEFVVPKRRNWAGWAALVIVGAVSAGVLWHAASSGDSETANPRVEATRASTPPTAAAEVPAPTEPAAEPVATPAPSAAPSDRDENIDEKSAGDEEAKRRFQPSRRAGAIGEAARAAPLDEPSPPLARRKPKPRARTPNPSPTEEGRPPGRAGVGLKLDEFETSD